MTQIYNNYNKTIIHLFSPEAGVGGVDKYLYPYGRVQSNNFFIFISPVYNNYQYVLTVAGSAGATATATITKTSLGGSTSSGSGDTTYRGTAITGTSTSATTFSGSGITAAKVGDWYINTNNGNVYKCTTAGAASTAKWVYNSTQAILKNTAGEDVYMGIGTPNFDEGTATGAYLR